MTPDNEQAGALVALREGVARFKRTFLQTPPQVILRLGDDEGGYFARISREFRVPVVVWPSAAQTRALVRAALEDELKSLGMEQTPDVKTRIELMFGGGALSPIEIGTYQHEIGHALYAALFHPSAASTTGYGTPAPDWLDEAAGIALENEAFQELRRSKFRSAASPICAPLASLFTLRHPHVPSGRVGKVTVRVRVGSTSENAESLSAVSALYTRVRGLLDYFESLPPEYFANVVRVMSSGGVLEDALASAERRVGTGPSNASELQTEYDA